MYNIVNNAIVTIIPKTRDASRVKDFRPISCCTILYKIISKIMVNRLGRVIGQVVDNNQTMFILRNHMQDHVLLAYELIIGYSRKNSPLRYMIQMDLQKAYDSVEWIVVEAILWEMNFPHQFIRWVMLSIRIVSYWYNVNGDYTDLLVAKRWLRQGDPLSPLIFVIVMEYLYRIQQQLKEDANFNFHSKCEKMGIINLSFTEDLLLFTRGDHGSVSPLMQYFNKFTSSTGLSANPIKCKIYYNNVCIQDK